MTSIELPRARTAALLALALVAFPTGARAFTTTTTVSTASTLVSTTTSSSLLVDYDNGRMFGVFPSQPIASLKVWIRAFPDYGPDAAYCRFYGPGSAPAYFDEETTFSFATLFKGELDRSQAIINCDHYTHEPHGPLYGEGIRAVNVEARNSSGEIVPTTICLLAADHDQIPIPASDECRHACGDALCDGGEPKVSDSLAVLKRAIGAYVCPLRICDVNHDGEVTAADGLKVLRRAVQLRSVLLCTPKEFVPGECRHAGGDQWWEAESSTLAN
jgi:hypothetical protein